MADEETAPVLCFQHCEDVNVMCLKLPRNCPICDKSISSTPMRIPPFRIPSPFVHSEDASYSLVIRPTYGTFLRDYTKGANLHVGLSESRGVVYDFDEHGINRSLSGWNQCLAVELIPPKHPHLEPLWNTKLHEFTAYDDWLPERYSESTHNCYDFVLDFLRLLRLDSLYPCIQDKEQFCQEMVLPQSKKAAKYITIYRKLLEEEVIIQYPENSTQL